MRKFLFLLPVTFVLFSCSHKLSEGQIYNKEYHPAYTTVILMPMTICTGETSVTTLTPITFFYPDSWSVDIKDFDSKNNKWVTDTWWVSRDVFNQVVVGGWFKHSDSDNPEQPRERVK